MIIALVVLLGAAMAQDAPQPTAPAGGWWEQVKNKVKEVTGGASDLCSNQYVSGPYLEKVFCDKIIPDEYTRKLNNITFGADTDWCRGLACVYRAAGCVDPTYRIEAKIIAATGSAEECGVTVGLDPMHCLTLAKFIAAPPMTMKRSVEDEERAAVEMAALAVKIVAPYTEGIDQFLPDERKRQSVGDTLLSQLQVCSPLINAGLKVIEAQVKLPINISDHLGPCGTICNYAVCGLNVLCQTTARPILNKINSDRMFSNCPALTCANFAPKGIDVCGNATCPNAEGFWQSNSNCLPPKKVRNPTKSTKEDCCQTCDDRCNGVRCPAVNCPAPTYPSCVPYKIAKYDQFDCCEQCIDPCLKERAACPPAPTSCPPGQYVGPAAPGDCCLSCQPLCIGVSCAGGPQRATDCPANTVFQERPANVNQCADCCPKCVPKGVSPVDQKTMPTSASTVSLTVASVVAAIVLAMN